MTHLAAVFRVLFGHSRNIFGGTGNRDIPHAKTRYKTRISMEPERNFWVFLHGDFNDKSMQSFSGFTNITSETNNTLNQNHLNLNDIILG